MAGSSRATELHAMMAGLRGLAALLLAAVLGAAPTAVVAGPPPNAVPRFGLFEGAHCPPCHPLQPAKTPRG